MPSLTVWRYDSAPAAGAAEVRLKRLQERGLITVHDAITVTWMPGNPEPTIGHLRHATGAAAAKGSILGLIVGSLVMAPAAGAAAGAGVAALGQRLRGTGIDADVLASVRRVLVPGTSALLVLSSHEDIDAIEPLLREESALVHMALADDAPTALRQALERRRDGVGPH